MCEGEPLRPRVVMERRRVLDWSFASDRALDMAVCWREVEPVSMLGREAKSSAKEERRRFAVGEGGGELEVSV